MGKRYLLDTNIIIYYLGGTLSDQAQPFLKKAHIETSNISVISKIRRKYKKIKLPDAIIAATCLAYHFTLVTRNSSDFKNIATLDFINPFDL